MTPLSALFERALAVRRLSAARLGEGETEAAHTAVHHIDRLDQPPKR